MKDPIERQDALDAVFNFAECPDKAYGVIRKLPGITRCKDCVHYLPPLAEGKKVDGAMWNLIVSPELKWNQTGSAAKVSRKDPSKKGSHYC